MHGTNGQVVLKGRDRSVGVFVRKRHNREDVRKKLLTGLASCDGPLRLATSQNAELFGLQVNFCNF